MIYLQSQSYRVQILRIVVRKHRQLAIVFCYYHEEHFLKHSGCPFLEFSLTQKPSLISKATLTGRDRGGGRRKKEKETHED